MAPDTPHLDDKYTVLRLNVISSTSISNRTTTLLAHLKAASPDNKPPLIALTAKAQVANKLITIAEIAKRDLKDNGIKVYQYNALGSEMIELKPAAGDGEKEKDATDEEDAFENPEQRAKVRSVPTMTAYLALVPVKELRDAYGEQTG